MSVDTLIDGEKPVDGTTPETPAPQAEEPTAAELLERLEKSEQSRKALQAVFTKERQGLTPSEEQLAKLSDEDKEQYLQAKKLGFTSADDVDKLVQDRLNEIIPKIQADLASTMDVKTKAERTIKEVDSLREKYSFVKPSEVVDKIAEFDGKLTAEQAALLLYPEKMAIAKSSTPPVPTVAPSSSGTPEAPAPQIPSSLRGKEFREVLKNALFTEDN